MSAWAGLPQPAGTVIARSASTRRRSRLGITCTTLASTRTEDSAMPSTAPSAAVCNPTARATASSSSITSGGSTAPAASW
ncbi:predicted protein [Streptomyces iranensis]|nr:predicted protein [Streptomyces iranensis]